MLVIFETLEKELLKVDLEHVPSKGEAVTVFDTVYQVDNVMYETTIRIKPSGKRGVKQIAICEISPIYRGDQINPNDVWCNSKPNPYMPYEYCSTQLKSATENNDLVHVPVGGTIRAELYNIIKDRLEHGGIEYHECDSTRIDKKEYETLYNVIGHKYDDLGDNAEVSDFRLPNAKGWYIRIK